jgi:hypothetical protein
MRDDNIKMVIVGVANPVGPGDLGRATEAHYFINNGVLAMCDERGDFVRNAFGEPYTCTLKADERAEVVAKNLALKIYRASSQESDFNRPIRYEKVVY